MSTPTEPAPSSDEFLPELRALRQSRFFTDRPVPREDLERILDIARWTGSAKNSQPWHLVVVEDRETNAELATYGAFTQFLAGVAASIVIVLDGDGRSQAYDEGRLSERAMLAAAHLGLGSGTAWFGTSEARAQVRELLGIPEHLHPYSAVGLGYTDASRAQAAPALRGRKPFEEIVSWGRYSGPAT
ncbi:nitroreductase [Beutenbergia cavernae DSM 12333]|uniref:Nitroreductase n=1 Tax=Beutenbergia cavernae (strain ATCC BAA-8 / DSM 12333 / CCUG 43141 / JCM 11478 / NBRC 16432 / NCIMB 13614 / HKI 0122) TaxID=471853 RepID=C5BUT8_BEUC1|nr:nitroreductase family protein [Beutenbergia cavernae]ACQ78312.1 nitroreductase [Beutenbergia cavernae DSM 12333]